MLDEDREQDVENELVNIRPIELYGAMWGNNHQTIESLNREQAERNENETAPA